MALSVEVGYGHVFTINHVTYDALSALITSLYYGYMIHDNPESMTLLSLAAGYNLLPPDAYGQTYHHLVYGLEFAHIFFRTAPVSLLIDYGLLFNLILRSEQTGYAFGHHTKLGVGVEPCAASRPDRDPRGQDGGRSLSRLAA